MILILKLRKGRKTETEREIDGDKESERRFSE